MSKGRQKHYLTQLSEKDKLLCLALKNCSLVVNQQFVSKNRIESFRKEGVIEKLILINNKEKLEIWKITPKGKAFINKEIDYCRNRSFYNSSSPKHDISLFKAYSQLSATEMKTWKTEKENAQMIHDRKE